MNNKIVWPAIVSAVLAVTSVVSSIFDAKTSLYLGLASISFAILSLRE